MLFTSMPALVHGYGWAGYQRTLYTYAHCAYALHVRANSPYEKICYLIHAHLSEDSVSMGVWVAFTVGC